MSAAAWNVREVSANATAAWNDAMLVTTGGTNKTITLPTAAGNGGKKILVKKVDSAAGSVIIVGSQPIDGSTDITLVAENEGVVVFADAVGTASVKVESRT